MSRQRFTPEFKEEAVKQVASAGTACRKWRPFWASRHTVFTSGGTAVSPSNAEQQSKELLEAKNEILRLRSQMRRVEEERDLLKKAARYFASEPE